MTSNALDKLIEDVTGKTRIERDNLKICVGELQTLLREAHSLLNCNTLTFRMPTLPWRDRMDEWNKAFEKVSGR